MTYTGRIKNTIIILQGKIDSNEFILNKFWIKNSII